MKQDMQEEELKNKVAVQWFGKYDCTRIVGKIDFCVGYKASEGQPHLVEQSLLWAEAKKGEANPYISLVQLVLTIGRARTFNDHLPPPFLGAFDAEKIAFLPYSSIMDIFSRNDFNWLVAPSNHETREFKELYDAIKSTLETQSLIFYFDRDTVALQDFIKHNFKDNIGVSKIKIDKNNFMAIYQRWRLAVMPAIMCNWSSLRNIIDGDFYLADLLSRDNESIKDKLRVLFHKTYYEMQDGYDAAGMLVIRRADFSDRGAAHNKFWNIYERPPIEEYWDYIVKRRDLLVPQDIRERKGSFFTPQKWVELSQQSIAKVLGEDWQENYVVWDPAAGTGNLLAGLTEKYNLWASTLDKADVDVMHDRIANGANLLDGQVFQFDFLNDSFDDLPPALYNIVNDEEKRKHLVIYMNPPYAEASTKRQIVGTGKNKKKVATTTYVYHTYSSRYGAATRELFTQFLIRICEELPGCIIANFSTLKGIQASSFRKFRERFNVCLNSLFLIPGNTFDNVNGKFPIGFFVWDTAVKEVFNGIGADIYNAKGEKSGTKTVCSYDHSSLIIKWLRNYYDAKSRPIGYLRMAGTDMQNHNCIFISNNLSDNDIKKCLYTDITMRNVIPVCIYYSIRHCVAATWLNDRDQFLWPCDTWKNDKLFQNDCLTYALFTNRVKSTCVSQKKGGFNYWMPFTAQEVNSPSSFNSTFMSSFIAGKPHSPENAYDCDADSKETDEQKELIDSKDADASFVPTAPLEFSSEAKAVFDAGRKLWQLYMAESGVDVNASLYEIRIYFQGTDDKGHLDIQGGSDEYKDCLAALRDALKTLAARIETKVYEHKFLVR